MFEQSQIEGAIKVVAIYEAANNILHIFLARTEPLDQNLSAVFREKAAAFLDVSLNELDSLAFFFERPPGRDPRRELVPPSMEGYGQAFLHVGGLKAVQSQPGWASWTQLWPEASGAVRRDPGSPDRFDVSNIDTGNIPEPDCDELLVLSRTACKIWKLYPDTGIAGFHRDLFLRIGDRKYASYMQIKETLLPVGEGEQQTLKQRLLPGYDEFPNSHDLELVQVKYDYGELWRWATILNRFAPSASNTIGIVSADVDTNHFSNGGHLLLLDEWELADNSDSSTVRIGVLGVADGCIGASGVATAAVDPRRRSWRSEIGPERVT